MTEEEKKIWNQISLFKIEANEEDLDFVTLLALKNKWTHFFTLQAIEEYKKIIFLQYISNKTFSLPKSIEKVESYHKTFKESYKKLEELQNTLRNTITTPPNNELLETLYNKYFNVPNSIVWESSNPPESNYFLFKKTLATLLVLSLFFVVCYFLIKPTPTVVSTIEYDFSCWLLILVTMGIIHSIMLDKMEKLGSHFFETNQIVKNLDLKEILYLKESTKGLVHATIDHFIRTKKMSIDPITFKINLNKDAEFNDNYEFAFYHLITTHKSIYAQDIANYHVFLEVVTNKKIFLVSKNAINFLISTLTNTKRFTRIWRLTLYLIFPSFLLLSTRLIVEYNNNLPYSYSLSIFLIYLFILTNLFFIVTNSLTKGIINQFKKNIDYQQRNSWKWKYITTKENYCASYLEIYNSLKD